MSVIVRLMGMCLLLSLSSCTYLKYASIQAEYEKMQAAEPSQMNLKHLLNRESFFVLGKSVDDTNEYADTRLAIAAYSSKFRKNERVDTMFFRGAGRHYGLALPEGEYVLLVYADINNDRVLHQSEVVGEKHITINVDKFPEKIAKNINVPLTKPVGYAWAEAISIPEIKEHKTSLFYPEGTIRSLDDPLFDDSIATMGMYDPASFLEYAPTMFYALEEDVVHKIPVIFVHGIGGSSRSFKPIIDRLDSERYRFWFFYYPSGGDLEQFADFFYSLFLSGDVIALDNMPMIVVAHSMGGLIVREAINNYMGSSKENKIELFVSIASPFGGHPAAAAGEEHGLIVLPAWKDLNPASEFIQGLYRKPLPDFLNHQLYYAYKNGSTLKGGDNSDGVVPLFSQLNINAQRQSRHQFGFNSEHVSILENEDLIHLLSENMGDIESFFPESHMKILAKGGVELDKNVDYEASFRHLMSYAGKYLILLVRGEIKPVHPDQVRFIDVAQGRAPAVTMLEKEFLRFIKNNLEQVSTVLQ